MPGRIIRFAETHSRAVLFTLLALALLFGLREALSTGNLLRGWDAADYDNVATNLLAGKGFVREGTGEILGKPVEFRLRGHRPPAYPLFLALVYRISNHNVRVVYILQALLLALTGYVVYRLALLCFCRRAPALLTLLLYSVYLPMHRLVGQISTEVLQVFFLVRWMQTLGTRPLALSALCLGLAILTRPTPFLLPFVLLFLFAAAPLPTWRSRARAFSVFGLLTLAVISPWMLRQAVLFETFVPVTTGGGITLWEGTGAAGGRTVPGWALPSVPDEIVAEFGGFMDACATGYSREVELDRAARARARTWIRRHPGRYARLTLIKAPKFWLGLDFERARPLDPISPKSVIGLLMEVILLGAAVAGALRAARKRSVFFLGPASVILYFSFVHMFPYVLHRYSLPVHPLIMLFSAAGILALVERRFKQDVDPESGRPHEPESALGMREETCEEKEVLISRL